MELPDQERSKEGGHSALQLRETFSRGFNA